MTLASRRPRRSMRTVSRWTERGARHRERGTPPPPAAGAIVMATGIVSIVLDTASRQVLSGLLLWVSVAVWTALAALLASSVARGNWEAVRAGARSPAALTAVAGTCVVGTRLAPNAPAAAAAALVLGAIVWAALQPLLWRHWQTPTSGAAFMATVSSEALAVLCAAVAHAYSSPWLVVAGAVFATVGIAAYPVVAATFDRRQLVTGGGDQWVAGGALAIAALAAADLATSARALTLADSSVQVLETASVVLAGAAAVWLPLLVAAEVARPRPHYDLRRWATVFPVAMYSAAGTAVGRLADSGVLVTISAGWTWVALALWAVVSLGLLRRATGEIRDRWGPAEVRGPRAT
jgi:tellurite resistance protein TehA-like permease